MRNSNILSLAMVGISVLMSFFLLPYMPERIAFHWNSFGEVDGYVSKNFGLFVLPAFLILIFLLLRFVPRLDPLKENVEKFQREFNNFISIIVLFFFYIYSASILWNLGYEFNMNLAIVPAMAVLFFYSGVLISKAKRNYFIGIRTPWTLSSDEVWDKTHQFGGKLFKISGAVCLVAILFGKFAFAIIISVVLAAALMSIIYSYLIWRRSQSDS